MNITLSFNTFTTATLIPNALLNPDNATESGRHRSKGMHRIYDVDDGEQQLKDCKVVVGFVVYMILYDMIISRRLYAIVCCYAVEK